MVLEKLICKGSSAVTSAICIVKYISCLNSNPFRFSSSRCIKDESNLERQKLNAVLKIILIRAVGGEQEDYLCFSHDRVLVTAAVAGFFNLIADLKCK